jgi:AAA family ATPase
MKMFTNIPNNLTDRDYNLIASKAHGFVGADLKSVVQNAGMIALRRHMNTTAATTTAATTATTSTKNDLDVVMIDDVLLSLSKIKPSAMREISIDVPKVYWNDIGGQETIKNRLKEAVEWPLSKPKLFISMGISPPKGVLLYGPPGCSKTLMAKAVATESGMYFFSYLFSIVVHY